MFPDDGITPFKPSLRSIGTVVDLI